jgi:ribosomal protein L29
MFRLKDMRKEEKNGRVSGLREEEMQVRIKEGLGQVKVKSGRSCTLVLQRKKIEGVDLR